MIIRSQNKDAITSDLNLWIDKYGNEVVIKNSKFHLGWYSTREKAIKVLNMICEQYQYCQECKYTGIGVSQPEFVFQMPQDSEV